MTQQGEYLPGALEEAGRLKENAEGVVLSLKKGTSWLAGGAAQASGGPGRS
jgi:hypothetical protein